MSSNSISGHPYLVPDLRNASSISALNKIMVLVLRYKKLIMLRKYSTISIFLIMNSCWIHFLILKTDKGKESSIYPAFSTESIAEGNQIQRLGKFLYRTTPAIKQRRKNHRLRISLFTTPDKIINVWRSPTVATFTKREIPGITYLLMKVYTTIY